MECQRDVTSDLISTLLRYKLRKKVYTCLLVSLFVWLPACLLRAGVVFDSVYASVCLCVCSHKISKTEMDVSCYEHEHCWMLELVTFDFESYFHTYLSYNFWTAWPSNFVFRVEICLADIYVLVQFQGNGAKVKVTAAKTGTQVCAHLGHSLILFCILVRVVCTL